MNLQNFDKKFYYEEISALAILYILSALFLFYDISTLSISYKEAYTFFNEKNIISYIANASCKLFGQNDYALRTPFLFFHFLNIFLIFKISKNILKRPFDSIISAYTYAFLPGVMVGAILFNQASIIIFITLIIVYFCQKNFNIAFFIIIIVSIFIDKAFVILYFTLFLYGIYSKNKALSILTLILFFIGIYIYDFNIYGKPKGFFLDTIAIYATVFSLFVFLFYIYAIYRVGVKEKKDITWFISCVSFIICLIMSFRQQIDYAIYLPFCVIFVPYIIRIFLNSYRSRLPRFRKFHKIYVSVALIVLFFSSFVIVFNQFLYLNIFSKNPSEHFIYQYDIAKELANYLDKEQINAVNTDDKKLRLRLKFYGIDKDGFYFLSTVKPDFYSKNIDVKKYDKIIAKFFIF